MAEPFSQHVIAFICERVLIEKDDIPSIVRMVDVFFIPEGAPPEAPFRFYLFVSVKTLPAKGKKITLSVTLINTLGERDRLPDPDTSEPPVFRNDPSVPTGTLLIAQISVVPKHMGTCFLEVEVNGKVEATVPFTLRRPDPVQDTEQKKS
jgi:hypothetical protein